MSGSPDLLERLAGILPPERISRDPDILRSFTEGLWPEPEGEVACTVTPSDPAQVRAVVELARDAGLNLVPVSSGPPHLKGGTAPSGSCVIVDLSAMDRIIRLDRRNRVAIVEPGVTFAALTERASAEGLRPMTPLLPRTNKSVLGSYLDREPAIIPKYQWDATDPLLCTEVVFGTGDVFRTGSAAGPGTLEDQWGLGNAQKNPMGPAATDLARLVQGAQGTLGIVTWASVRLELEPEIRRFHRVTGPRIEPLLSLARELTRRKLGDEMFLLDSVNLACVEACASGGEPAPERGARQYTLFYAAAGYHGYLPEDRVAFQEADIADIERGLGVEGDSIVRGQAGDGFTRLLDGPCPEPHWKSRLRGASLDVFFLTTMGRVPAFIEVMEGVAGRHGIEPGALGTYVQPVQQGRACHLEFNIFYDPAGSEGAAVARSAAVEAGAAMAGMGAFFSRPYEPWVRHAYDGCPDTVEALRKVKRIFDPGGVMNRGKLCFTGGDGDPAR